MQVADDTPAQTNRVATVDGGCQLELTIGWGTIGARRADPLLAKCPERRSKPFEFQVEGLLGPDSAGDVH